MTKREFLGELRSRLSSLPEGELSDRLDFYSEMIDDFIEEGNSEEAAVLKIGTVDGIASQILSEVRCGIPKCEAAGKDEGAGVGRKERRKIGAFEAVLLILGAPVWLSLLVAAVSVVLSLYAVVWSVIISLWAVFVSFAVCGFAGVLAGAVFAVTGQVPIGLLSIGAGLILSGLSIFTFFGCYFVTRSACILTRKIIIYTKNKLTGKEKKR